MSATAIIPGSPNNLYSPNAPVSPAPSQKSSRVDAQHEGIDGYLQSLKDKNPVEQLTLQLLTGLTLHSKVSKTKEESTWLEDIKWAYKQIKTRNPILYGNDAPSYPDVADITEHHKKIKTCFKDIGPGSDITDIDHTIRSAIEEKIFKNENENGNIVLADNVKEQIEELLKNIETSTQKINEINVDKLNLNNPEHRAQLEAHHSNLVEIMAKVGLFLFVAIFYTHSTGAIIPVLVSRGENRTSNHSANKNESNRSIQNATTPDIKIALSEKMVELYIKYDEFAKVLKEKDEQWRKREEIRRGKTPDRAPLAQKEIEQQTIPSSPSPSLLAAINKEEGPFGSVKAEPFVESIKDVSHFISGHSPTSSTQSKPAASSSDYFKSMPTPSYKDGSERIDFSPVSRSHTTTPITTNQQNLDEQPLSGAGDIASLLVGSRELTNKLAAVSNKNNAENTYRENNYTALSDAKEATNLQGSNISVPHSISSQSIIDYSSSSRRSSILSENDFVHLEKNSSLLDKFIAERENKYSQNTIDINKKPEKSKENRKRTITDSGYNSDYEKHTLKYQQTNIQDQLTNEVKQLKKEIEQAKAQQFQSADALKIAIAQKEEEAQISKNQLADEIEQLKEQLAVMTEQAKAQQLQAADALRIAIAQKEEEEQEVLNAQQALQKLEAKQANIQNQHADEVKQLKEIIALHVKKTAAKPENAQAAAREIKYMQHIGLPVFTSKTDIAPRDKVAGGNGGMNSFSTNEIPIHDKVTEKVTRIIQDAPKKETIYLFHKSSEAYNPLTMSRSINNGARAAKIDDGSRVSKPLEQSENASGFPENGKKVMDKNRYLPQPPPVSVSNPESPIEKKFNLPHSLRTEAKELVIQDKLTLQNSSDENENSPELESDLNQQIAMLGGVDPIDANSKKSRNNETHEEAKASIKNSKNTLDARIKVAQARKKVRENIQKNFELKLQEK